MAVVRDHPDYSASEEETGHIHKTVDPAPIWRWTFIAAGVSLVINVIIYFIGTNAGWIPDDMPEATQLFSLGSVVLASVIPVLLFGLLMVFLANNAPRASRAFAITLLVVLILAVMVPLTLQGLDDSFQYTLIAMHIVTAAAIYSLTLIPHN